MNPSFTNSAAMNPGMVQPSGHVSNLFSLVILAVVLALAAYGEIKESRIPNWLTLSGMAAGLALGYLNGQPWFISSLVGLGFGFGFLFIFYIFGGVGGGDVKLMGAAGALLGAELVKPALFYTAVIGAFLAVMMVVWQKDFWTRAGWMLQRLVFWRKPEGEQPPKASPVAVPYGLAIAAGCLLALFVRS